MNDWRPMSEAPRDGTRVDLLYPYPRGRQTDCYYETEGPLRGLWVRRDLWDYVTLSNMEPLFWMPVPTLPDIYLNRR